MRPDIAHRHRVLARAFAAYLAADRAWRMEAGWARLYFPPADRPPSVPIGDPGSRVRRLHEARERALLRFLAAREKLEAARRRPPAAGRQVRLIVRR